MLTRTAGISNDAGSYSWAVPSDLGDAKVYGLVIKLSDDSSVFQYSNPFTIEAAKADATTAVVVSATTAVDDYAVKTVSLSTATTAVDYTVPASGDYTTVVPVVNTVTVPCNSTATPPPYTVPAQPTGTVVPNSYSNATWTTAVYVPPASTQGSSSATTTPVTPVTGAGARFSAGSFAVVGGLLIAALAL